VDSRSRPIRSPLTPPAGGGAARRAMLAAARALAAAPRATPASALALAAALVLAAAPISCRKSAPPAGEAAVPVEVEVVAAATIDETTSLTGVLEAYRAVDVVAETSGAVRSLAADVGDRLARGALLASLDKEVARETLHQAEAGLLAAEARREVARADFDRDSTLFAGGDISPAAFEGARLGRTAARADAQAARATRELAARNLRQTDIRAPFAGTVSRRHCAVGTFASPGMPLFRLVDIDSLRLVLSVAQSHIARLAPGSPLELAVEALAGARFPARVRSLSPEADALSRTFPVEAVLANPPGGPLRDGFIVRAELVLDRHESAVAVPREAILGGDDGRFVFVVQDSLARRRAVATGPQVGRRVLVAAGLAPGERLVVAGAHNLKDGARVRVEAESRPAPGGGAPAPGEGATGGAAAGEAS